MSRKLLQVRGLRLDGPDGPILDGFGLEVAEGEVVGLAGPSGAGKSMLAAAVAGLLPGGVRHSGGEIVRPPGGVGWAMQDAHDALDPLRSLLGELRVTQAVHAPQSAGDPAWWGEALGLARAQLSRRPAGLSGGQRQRGVLALSLCAEPALLLADEPTASLDPATREAVGHHLRAAARRPGRGVLLISHDDAFLARWADRVVRLDDGPTRLAGSLAAPGPPGATVLRLRGVSYRIGSRSLLDGVSLTVPAGRTLALVGPSGSGKSTVARLAAGLLEPSAGEVVRPARVAMVFQDAYGSLDPFWSVGRAVAEPLPRGLPGAARRREVAGLLTAVGLAEAVAMVRPYRLSGGQRQRVAIARALAARPDLLICDEPTSALDPRSRATVLRLLRARQAEQGFAMLLASHDAETVAGLADEVRALGDGRLRP